MNVDLSFVIPVYNEAESLAELTAGIAEHVPGGLSYEIIFIDDGSTDDSWECIEQLKRDTHAIRAFRFITNYGKSAALSCGLAQVRGEVVFTMDSDLQDDPREIPRFLETLREGYDLVCGWRRRRRDHAEKRAASRVFNRAVQLWTGVRLHDMNIGYKCFSNRVARALRLSSDMHRFIPVLARDAGFKRFTEIEIEHHPRKYGASKYGFERYRRGFFDLVTVLFLARCSGRPMQLLGPIGVILVGLGLLAGVAAIGLAFAGTTPLALTAFVAASMLALTGLQSGLLGLIGELIVAHVRDPASQYIVRETLE